MKLVVLTSLLLVFAMAVPTRAADEKSPLEFKVDSIDGKPVDLQQYKGNVVLIVNVASQCGLTPQYKQLEEVYTKYKGQGLQVLGFPANEFGKQEPGTNAEIAKFCTGNYNVDFPMFSKIVVKGEGINPLYSYLTSDKSGFAGGGLRRRNVAGGESTRLGEHDFQHFQQTSRSSAKRREARRRCATRLPGWFSPSRFEPAYFLAISASIAWITSGASGLTLGANRLTTLPSRPIRNFSKFQLIGPAKPLLS